MSGAELPILLVEKSVKRAGQFRRAFEKNNLLNPIYHATDATQARNYLCGKHHYGNRPEFPLPHVIAINFKEEMESGWELLHWVRKHSEFNDVVIIFFGTEGTASEAQFAFRHGASGYHPMPNTSKELEGLVKRMAAHWLSTCPL